MAYLWCRLHADFCNSSSWWFHHIIFHSGRRTQVCFFWLYVLPPFVPLPCSKSSVCFCTVTSFMDTSRFVSPASRFWYGSAKLLFWSCLIGWYLSVEYNNRYILTPRMSYQVSMHLKRRISPRRFALKSVFSCCSLFLVHIQHTNRSFLRLEPHNITLVTPFITNTSSTMSKSLTVLS